MRLISAIAISFLLTVCGAGSSGDTTDAGTPDAGACVPETNAAFCARLGATCGPQSADDNCGNVRTVTSCGVGGPSDGRVFALQKLTWGEGNAGEWKHMGFDLDGRASTGVSTDVCKPSHGGSGTPDGENGSDNSFGRKILPQLLSLHPTWVSDASQALASGETSTLLDLSCVPPTGGVAALAAKLFVGAGLGAPPKFDGTDTWPIAPEFLANPTDPAFPKHVFTAASISGSTFDAGTGGTFGLMIPVHGQAQTSWMTLTLHAARLTMTLAADRTSAVDGRLGGVLNTEEFVAELARIGTALDLCGSGLLPELVNQARQASDILSDGTQDPSRTCDGISIGLGFEVALAQLGGLGEARAVGTGCP